jgi:aliphatic sulfonates family ABC transporter substrate-binding protein
MAGNIAASRNRLFFVIGGIILSLAVVVTIINVVENLEKNRGPVVLRIKGATNPAGLDLTPLDGTVGIAIEHGLLDEELAKVNAILEVIQLTTEGGAGAGEILGSNSVDIASWGEIPILHSVASGLPLEIIAIDPFGGSRNGITVRSESGITSITDLKGKKVASTYGGNSHLFLSYVLHKNGLDINQDVEFVNLRSSERKIALLGGQIDAVSDGLQNVFQWEKEEGWAKVIFTVNDVPEWSGQGVTVVQAEYGKAHPEIVVAYLKAVVRAQEWVNENPDAFIKRQSEISSVPLWAYEYQYPNREYIQIPALGDREIEMLNNSKQALLQVGLEKRDFDLVSKINVSYMEQARKEILEGK